MNSMRRRAGRVLADLVERDRLGQQGRGAQLGDRCRPWHREHLLAVDADGLSGHLGAAGEAGLTYTDAGCVPAATSRPITWELPADMLDPAEGLRAFTDLRVYDSSSVVGCGPVPAR